MPSKKFFAPDCSQWYFLWSYWYLRKNFLTVFDKRGPEYLKNGFRYFTGFPNCLKKYIFRTFLTTKINIWKISRISLDSQDLPIWTFWWAKQRAKYTMLKKAWRAKYIAKCTILKIRKYYIDYQISILPISQTWVLETKECSK